MTKEITQTQPKMKDLTRRQIRYVCFRLQTEVEGGNAATQESTGTMSFVDKIKKHMESQDDFGEWKMFAKTWDVDEKSPLVVVKRVSSIYTDWNNVLKKEAKDIPIAPQATKIIEMSEPTAKSSTARDASGKFIGKSKNEAEPPKKKSLWDVLK